MASETSICNLALTGLGDSQILTIDEDSAGAIACKAIFNDMRDEVLREHPWNFAIKRVALALLAEAPVFEFDNFFQLPGDVLRVLNVGELQENLEWKREGDKIATNEEEANIIYISRIQDTTQWDSSFVTVFSARLEAELAYRITGSNAITELRQESYLLKLRKAKGADAQEGSQDTLRADRWIDSRGTNPVTQKRLTPFP